MLNLREERDTPGLREQREAEENRGVCAVQEGTRSVSRVGVAIRLMRAPFFMMRLRDQP